MKIYNRIIRSDEAPASTSDLWIRENHRTWDNGKITIEGSLWRFSPSGWKPLANYVDTEAEFESFLRRVKGKPNGLAPLDEAGLVPSIHLPSYVDDVLEYPTLEDFPQEGEKGKIYVALDTNLTYRWSGTQYIEISKSLALGESSTTAFPGDRGVALEGKVSNIKKTYVSTKAQELSEEEKKTVRDNIDAVHTEVFESKIKEISDKIESQGENLNEEIAKIKESLQKIIESMAWEYKDDIDINTLFLNKDVEDR